MQEKKIREKEYVTLFTYLRDGQPWSRKFMDRAGPQYAPLVFMIYHCCYFTICHIIALLAFYSELFHTLVTSAVVLFSFWNGSCYYVKFFEYTKRLSRQQKKSMQMMHKAISKTDESQS